MCVCVTERERLRVRETESERERDRGLGKNCTIMKTTKNPKTFLHRLPKSRLQELRIFIAPSHFVNMPFHQHAILSICHFKDSYFFSTHHFVKWQFCHDTFLSTDLLFCYLSLCNFVNFSFCKNAILSTFCFVKLPFCHDSVLITSHFVNMAFYQHAIMSNWHFICMSFCQLGISSACHYMLVIFSTRHHVNCLFCQLATLSTFFQHVNLSF
jgi:hypothetical protein